MPLTSARQHSFVVVALSVLILAACVSTPTGVDQETVDTTTPAFALVIQDGGNTAFASAWRLDSATGVATYTATSRCVSASGCPGYTRSQVAPRSAVDAVFALAQRSDFRTLKAHYPRPLVADVSSSTITVVVNGRRRSIDGEAPPPATAFVDALVALVALVPLVPPPPST